MSSTNGGLRIISLKAENFKNLKVVEITPTGEAVVISGRNGAGKSAVLDAIFTALTGKTPDEPIRQGQERAEITVKLERFTVKKVFTAKGVRLEITNPDGAVFKSPQTLLDQILGDLSFDPLAFSLLKAKEQRDLVARTVGLDFTQHLLDRKAAYEARTLVHREIENLRGALSQINIDADAPDVEVSLKDAMAKVEFLEGQQEDYEDAVNTLERRKAIIVSEQKDITQYREEIAALEYKILACQDKIAAEQKAIDTKLLPPPVTDAHIHAAKTALLTIEETNTKVRAKQQAYAQMESVQAKEQEAHDLTAIIERLDQEKAEAIKAAAFPVPGLTVSDDAVLFNGIPFSQISKGQQIRVSTAMAMALNPKLKVIFIRDGSLLDSSGLQDVVAMAKTGGYQIFVEKVDESQKVGIYLEEGEVKAVNA